MPTFIIIRFFLYKVTFFLHAFINCLVIHGLLRNLLVVHSERDNIQYINSLAVHSERGNIQYINSFGDICLQV